MRGWLLSVVVFVAGAAAWALALPVNGTYDEKQHIVRAYAVATGRLGPVGTAVDTLGRRTEAFRAPRSLLPVGTSVDCTWWQPPRPASCQRFTTDRTEILMPTVAGHYSPTYYALVGWPLRISPDRTGVVAARLLSALLSGLLLGSALSLALRSGRRVLVAAVTAVATPTALNLAGAVNPNGLEIAAGILTATALAVRLRGEADRATAVLAGVGGFVLLTTRQLGPVLAGLLVATFYLLGGRLRSRPLAATLAAGMMGYLGWLLWSGGAVPMTAHRLVRLSPAEKADQLLTHRLPFCLKQMVAQFSYGEVDVSPVAVCCWYLLVAGLVVGALRAAPGRARLGVAGLGVASLGLLVAMDLHFVDRYGWFSQGRYALPAAVGVVLFAVAAGRWDRRWLPWLAVAVTVPIQVYSLLAVSVHFHVR